MPIFYFCLFCLVSMLSIYHEKINSQIMRAYILFEDRRDISSPLRCDKETFVEPEKHVWKKLAWTGKIPCFPPRTDYASPSDGYKKLPPALCILAQMSGIKNLGILFLQCPETTKENKK